jgi:hypothetical protein
MDEKNNMKSVLIEMGIAVSVNIEEQSRLQKRRIRELKKIHFDVQNIADLVDKSKANLLVQSELGEIILDDMDYESVKKQIK